MNLRLLGAILLVAGTAIGAGTLALPVVTGIAGFWPSLGLFVLLWCCMTFTAFLMLEVNLWMNESANLISMAMRTLGRMGAAIAWIVYLLLLYALTSAYISGCAPLVVDAGQLLFHLSLPNWVGTLSVVVVFGAVVSSGISSVDWFNRLLMAGLFVGFLLLIGLISPEVQLSHFNAGKWELIWPAVPVVVTSFGFHIIIPSLRSYLHHNVKRLRQAILIGSILPLLVYLIWQALILGAIPLEGKHGLAAIYAGGRPTIDLAHALDALIQSAWASVTIRFFSFFLIVTSFLGVSLSLMDFLADGLKVKKSAMGKVQICLLTFAPPLVFALVYPKGFVLALSYAGSLVAILLMLFPIAMVWIGRYHKQITATYRVIGGRAALIIAGLTSLAVIVCEVAADFVR